ncbi:MAG: hypothetical protein V1858_00890 [Candidatus Gottesmanbacteria bacterium]
MIRIVVIKGERLFDEGGPLEVTLRKHVAPVEKKPKRSAASDLEGFVSREKRIEEMIWGPHRDF